MIILLEVIIKGYYTFIVDKTAYRRVTDTTAFLANEDNSRLVGL